MPEVPELLLIDKPKGITSMGVIRVLRKDFGIKKMGHAGTLDPLATGLMLVGVGKGTKALADLIKLDKEYVAEIRIGERRTTGDLEGEIIEEKAIEDTAVDLERKILDILPSMTATLTLPVSAYSAIKVGGVAMYKRARKAEKTGEQVTEVPIREMKVFEIELLGLEMVSGKAVANVRFLVGSGTYIRSLAEELGRRISYPATLQNLRRTKVGEFDIKNARPLERDRATAVA